MVRQKRCQCSESAGSVQACVAECARWRVHEGRKSGSVRACAARNGGAAAVQFKPAANQRNHRLPAC